MPRHHTISSPNPDYGKGKPVDKRRFIQEDVPFTAEEEDARDAEEAAAHAQEPMDDWLGSMAEADAEMPRWFEDYIDDNGITLAPGRTKDNHAVKKELRADKPPA